MTARALVSGIERFARAEREVLLAFAGTRLLVCVLAVAAFNVFQHGGDQILPSTRPWNLLFHWDALWYARIVQQGYDYTPGVPSSVNFFPLFPLVVGAFRWLTGAWTPFAGFIISNAALLGAGICLRRLASLDYAGRIPERAVWLLFLCPATFFHSAGYAESLFLLLSLGAVLCARRGKWMASAIAGALLTASHGNALLILIPLGWEALREKNAPPPNESRWWLLFVPAGLIAYAAYLQWRFGDALAFAHNQSAFYRELSSPWAGFSGAWQEPWPNGALQLTAAAAGIFLSWIGYRTRLRAGYLGYAIAMLVLTLSTPFLTATPRLLCEIFPFYLVLAAVTMNSEGAFLLTLAASAGVMAISLALFVCGYPMV